MTRCHITPPRALEPTANDSHMAKDRQKLGLWTWLRVGNVAQARLLSIYRRCPVPQQFLNQASARRQEGHPLKTSTQRSQQRHSEELRVEMGPSTAEQTDGGWHIPAEEYYPAMNSSAHTATEIILKTITSRNFRPPVAQFLFLEISRVESSPGLGGSRMRGLPNGCAVSSGCQECSKTGPWRCLHRRVQSPVCRGRCGENSAPRFFHRSSWPQL